VQKDIISKQIIKKLLIKDIAKYILNKNIGEDFIFLDKEFERIESRRADIVVKVNSSYILHLEIQSSYDNKMAYRMLRYFLDIREITPLPIEQYLINLSLNNIPSSIKEFKYSYKTINIKELDCNYFLNQNTPEAIVIAILCDFKGKEPSFIINKILTKLKSLSKDENEFRKYVIMTEELSGLRKLKKSFKEAEMRFMDISWEDLPSYEIGMEKGFERGIEKGIEKGIKKGIEKGIEKGKEIERIKFINAMIKLGIKPSQIAKELNVDESDILKFIDNNAS
jgi:predicted transposase/invertase (TIGR01784 family)